MDRVPHSGYNHLRSSGGQSMGKIKKTETPARRNGNAGLAKADPIKTGMIRARIDPALKDRAETILNHLGLNASDAIRLFYTQIILADGLPFPVKIPNAETIQAMK